MGFDRKDAGVIREMINQEMNLINHRFTWLTTLQGLLFTALGFAWDKPRQLACVLVAVGIASAGTVWLSIFFATRAIGCLVEDWERMKPAGYDGPRVIGAAVPRGLRMLLPWFTLPVIFAIGWMAIFFFVPTGSKQAKMTATKNENTTTTCKLIPALPVASKSKIPPANLPAQVICESTTSNTSK